MTFSNALNELQLGKKIAREGWNGKDMFIYLMSGLLLTADKVNDRTKACIGEGVDLDSQPYIAMMTADKKWQPGWLASQADILTADWVVVE